MENETIIKNETQVLDAIEKYLKDLYTSASSATQEEHDSFIQALCLPKLSDDVRDGMPTIPVFVYSFSRSNGQ